MLKREELQRVYDVLTIAHGGLISRVEYMTKRKATMHNTKIAISQCVDNAVVAVADVCEHHELTLDIVDVLNMLRRVKQEVLMCKTKSGLTYLVDTVVVGMCDPMNRIMMSIPDDTQVQGSDNAALATVEDESGAYNCLRGAVCFWRMICGYSKGAVISKVQNWTNLAYTFAEVADAKIKVLAELATETN